MTSLMTDLTIVGNPPYPTLNTWENSPHIFAKGWNFLQFPPEAEMLLTSFRYETLNRIYWSAEELCPKTLVSATVNFYSPADGEGCERLNLFLEVGTDWEGIDKLERAIIQKIVEWGKGWTDDEWAEYSERIHFALIPASP